MSDYIQIKNATEHNLKGISLQIPKNKITVFTGVSGSGKSTLAFNTIYAEGQRRYLESLSAYSRQFLGSYSKPEVELITGLCPTIAISQKTYSYNPRSTVATVTEIYDYLRILFAKIGIPYLPQTNQPIKAYSKQEIVDNILLLPEGTKAHIISPLTSVQTDSEIESAKRKGFVRIAVNSKIFSIYDKYKINPGDKVSIVVDRIIINNALESRIAGSIDSATELNCELIEVEVFPNEDNNSYCMAFPVRQIDNNAHKDSVDITPRLFSFNNPLGACKKCKGIGKILLINPELVVPDQSKTLLEGAIWPFFDPSLPNIELKTYEELRKLLTRLAKKYQFNLNTPWKDLPADIQYILLYGSQEADFKGTIPILESDQEAHPLIKQRTSICTKPSSCTECKGYRLNSNVLHIKIAGLHIGEMNSMCIDDAESFFKSLLADLTAREQKIAAPILSEICKRLAAIRQIGLGYLTLDREAVTLSGGEAQRVRIVSQIGTGLSGIIYVLDEPSIGLHYNEKASLIAMIQELKELGNTVIIVEHDEEMISNADHIVELGPESGYHGGQIVATGTLEEIKNNPHSITGCYLSGSMCIASPARHRTYDRVVTMHNVNKNNLVNINVAIPLGVLVAVTGASGSGKSTLISDILGSCAETLHHDVGMLTHNPYCQSIRGLEYVTSIIQINNNALTKTLRSNPATYINIFNDIRALFAAQPDAKSLGFGISKFSFNGHDGKCSMCNGHGTFKVEMHFLADVEIVCESCNGKRYNREALMVKYRGKDIASVMELTVDEAILFFSSFANICKKLIVLQKVGLGYLRIGQTANTLSGGEAQRVKIAKELSRGPSTNMLYIMDEPTTGLHTHDIKNLIMVLNQLIDKGNTVVVIEHNINVIKNADYIIEMGHGGGRHGGKIIAYGTPTELANNHSSYIGQYLR